MSEPVSITDLLFDVFASWLWPVFMIMILRRDKSAPTLTPIPLRFAVGFMRAALIALALHTFILSIGRLGLSWQLIPEAGKSFVFVIGAYGVAMLSSSVWFWLASLGLFPVWWLRPRAGGFEFPPHGVDGWLVWIEIGCYIASALFLLSPKTRQQFRQARIARMGKSETQ